MTDKPTVTPPFSQFLPEWVARQRWYAAAGAAPALRRAGGYRIEDPDGQVGIEVFLLRDTASSPPAIYHVPLTYRGRPVEGAEHALVAHVEHSELGGRWIYDAAHDPAYVRAAVQCVRLTQPEVDVEVELAGFRVLTGEQSNTSIVCELAGADPVILKVIRRISPGHNPDVELPAALTAAGCDDVPAYRGHESATWGDGHEGTLLSAQSFVSGASDAWAAALRACRQGRDVSGYARELGAILARIHRALADRLGTVEADAHARERLVASVRSRLAAAVAAVPDLSDAEPGAERLIAALENAPWPRLQRVHGDLHLGQVLMTGERMLVVDFEGEPLRPMVERTAPDLALRDVAGMLRSFDYAGGTVELDDPGQDRRDWVARAHEAFLAGYGEASGPILRALLLDKALYEVSYESAHRPDWVPIPLAAVARLLADDCADVPTETHENHTESETPMDAAHPQPEPPLEPHPVPTEAQVSDHSAIDAFLEGRHSQPHDLLGHHLGPGGLTVTAYRPMAHSVRARLADGSIMDLPHVRGGIWSGTSPAVTTTQDYRLLVDYGDGVEHEHDDPYRFAPSVGEMDRFLFNEGRHEQLWQVLGANIQRYPGPLGDVSGVSFAVWAPTASAVHVVGDFNGWDRLSHPMRLLGTSGLWELFIPGAGRGMNYQFAVRGADGIVRLKADPMAKYAEVAPKQASIVYESHYEWGDEEWMTARAQRDPHQGPMSIYEVHLGSWRQDLGYVGLAEHLVNYVKDLGFTHVEFLPVMEHPYVPSWGYHVTGYYAVSSRWGTPDDFRWLVDRLHRNGIGVILDWVPGHFATDQWALARFDGQPLYEHPDPRKGWHREWGSNVFDYARPEVKNFLVANATYWLEEFHIDGLRVDGVASMLYLDYSRNPGEWIPNIHGGRENLDAVQVLQETNATAYKRSPGVVTVAEESTSWPGVTHPTDADGLGFGFKWNMGWMNDTLRYLGADPLYRQFSHSNITFALVYAYSESYVLPISHDEVVHGKGSLMRKVPGDRVERLATVRAFLAHMWSHPGKQLLFMGCELGQESEWSEGRSLDWWLLDQPLHYRVHNLVKELNHLYRATPALWELDHSPAGFQWLNADDASHNTFSYLRFGAGDPAADAPVIAVVVNYSGHTHEPYRVGLPRGGAWQVVLDTAGFHPDAPSSAGLVLQAREEPWDGQPFSVDVVVPRLSAVWLAPVRAAALEGASS